MKPVRKIMTATGKETVRSLNLAPLLPCNLATLQPCAPGILFRMKRILPGLIFFMTILTGQATANPTDPALLLSRLDLNCPGLEQVKARAADPAAAVQALLTYYRERTSVKHPVDRAGKAVALNNCASAKDLETAGNAMKHIFVGQAAYPPYFCGDDINWNTRPVPDNEWVWQLNRMSFWDALGRAYWHTGDEQYAREWAAQLVDWTVKNPRDNDHAYAWRSIEAGIRGYRWTGLFRRFVDSPSFTPAVLTAFLNSCYDHASFLMTVYRSRSNWALMEAEGMAFIAMIFPEFRDAPQWQAEAVRRLNNEISLQVYPDGHQRELAMGYHLGCINWFMRTWELAKLNGISGVFPETYLQTVEKMCEVPMKLCFPDGTHTQFGDDWTGTPGQHSSQFAEWAEFFGRDDFRYLATNGEKGTPPVQTAFSLPQSGLYSMRSGWDRDAICLVLKCGPDGGGHCQPDNGTFTLYTGGRNLMPDGGSYIYSGDPENRAWFRQTRVHQTLTLDNRNSQYAPRLLHWETSGDLDILVVENDSYENLTHRRSVFFVDKKYFVVVDEAIGSATGEIDLHFQLAPAKAVFDHEKFTANSVFGEGWNVYVRTNPQKGLTMQEEEGQVSFRYTIKEPRPAFCYHLRKGTADQNIRFVTVVAPWLKEIPDIQVEPDKSAVAGGRSVSLMINNNGNRREIGYTLNHH